MKRIVLVLCFAFTAILTNAQETNYETVTNIPYYENELRKTDTYLSERCVLDIYYPKDVENFATVVWFHGGGITNGEKEIPEALKNKGIAIIGVNYRFSPKVKAPEYIKDAAAAVAWTFENIADYGGDPSRIFVSGHSAGGYLASMIGLDKSYLKTHGIDANDIAGLIPFSGHTITHFTVRGEQGIPGEQPTIDKYAPLFHVRKDAPPLLLITGDRELELLGRYEENAYLMRMMKVVGHKETVLYEMDGYGHGMTHPAFPLLINEIKRISEK
ncbi:alpha/beta hydrolase [Cyclobacterium qasimii]|uniref:Lipase n=2 Tax=Cyclobacterium qasimii TaxID=1350429 RepID=A0A512C808_9BACT|nr:alpha/beta hydrolase [Cyclobacterium qasimii]EPR67759.1 putative lipase [Cyclobacterium qasimii M12-11B]GEO20356.1 lipase [Cyclobacterium qasimii]